MVRDSWTLDERLKNHVAGFDNKNNNNKGKNNNKVVM